MIGQTNKQTNRNYNFIYIEIDTLDTYIMNLKINDQN